jgi:triacylglycerol lipase
MKRTFSNLCLALSLSLGTTAIITHSNTAIAASNINIQNVLQQERAWAGLQTKKLKVGDIEWYIAKEVSPPNRLLF